MIKPFIWMFGIENFRTRVFQLLCTMIVAIALAALFRLAGTFFNLDILVADALALIVLVSAICIIQGYFWEVTHCIVNREVSIEANNIYSGKIKKVYKITLPKFKLRRFLWRGIASIVASLLLVVPYLILVYTTLFMGLFSSPFFNGQVMFWGYLVSYTILLIFYFVSMPAVFWNYAAKDSVTAVWELGRIIYLMESYPGKYILNTVLFAIVYILNSFALFGMQLFLESFNLDSNWVILIQILVQYLIYLYLLHVYAYLIGTIAPPEEA